MRPSGGRWRSRGIKTFVSVMAALLAGCSVPGSTAGEPALVVIDDPWDNQYPMATLVNEYGALLIALPDADHGFYRGPRFDRGGMVVYARAANGRTVFGPIRPTANHVPTEDDHVAGTAEEFGMDSPLGFDDAAPGEGFVKIGVGVLERPDDEPYFFRRAYALLDPGEWDVRAEPGEITFRHTIDGPCGWAYHYIKTIRLHDSGPGFTISRTLENRGRHPITTDHYGHNFVILDGAPPGPGYRIVFPFKARAGESWKPNGNAEFRDGDVVLLRAVEGSIWGEVAGWSPDPADNAATVTTDAGSVSFHTDMPLKRLVFYSGGAAVCPEPFVAIELEPGEATTWRTRYEFR